MFTGAELPIFVCVSSPPFTYGEAHSQKKYRWKTATDGGDPSVSLDFDVEYVLLLFCNFGRAGRNT